MGATSAASQSSAFQGQSSSGKSSSPIYNQASGLPQPIVANGGKYQSLGNVQQPEALDQNDLISSNSMNKDQKDISSQSLGINNAKNQVQTAQPLTQPQSQSDLMNNTQLRQDQRVGNKITYPTTSGQQQFGKPMQNSADFNPYANTSNQKLNQFIGKNQGA